MSSSNATLKVGDKVVFGRPNGKKDTGVIGKVNPKSYAIKGDDGVKWRVSIALVNLVGEGGGGASLNRGDDRIEEIGGSKQTQLSKAIGVIKQLRVENKELKEIAHKEGVRANEYGGYLEKADAELDKLKEENKALKSDLDKLKEIFLDKDDENFDDLAAVLQQAEDDYKDFYRSRCAAEENEKLKEENEKLKSDFEKIGEKLDFEGDTTCEDVLDCLDGLFFGEEMMKKDKKELETLKGKDYPYKIGKLEAELEKLKAILGDGLLHQLKDYEDDGVAVLMNTAGKDLFERAKAENRRVLEAKKRQIQISLIASTKKQDEIEELKEENEKLKGNYKAVLDTLYNTEDTDHDLLGDCGDVCEDIDKLKAELDYELSFNEGDYTMSFKSKVEMKKVFDNFVEQMEKFGCITIETPCKRPNKIDCYGDLEVEDWCWGDSDEKKKLEEEIQATQGEIDIMEQFDCDNEEHSHECWGTECKNNAPDDQNLCEKCR